MQKRTGVPWGTVPVMLIEFHRYSLHFTSIPTNCDCQPRVTPPRGKESQWYTNEMTIKHIEFCRFPSMLLTQSKASAHTKLFQASMHSTAVCVYIYIYQYPANALNLVTWQCRAPCNRPGGCSLASSVRTGWKQCSKIFHPSERLRYANVAIPIWNSSFTSSHQWFRIEPNQDFETAPAAFQGSNHGVQPEAPCHAGSWWHMKSLWSASACHPTHYLLQKHQASLTFSCACSTGSGHSSTTQVIAMR